MAYWRMRIRAGAGGEDLWPFCKKSNLAAITYNGVHDVDLTPYSINHKPPGWADIESGPAKKSLSRFAWEIKGGDTIFVAHAASQHIVGLGHPRVPVGKLAYRFDPNSPVVTKEGSVWHHIMDVDWDDDFTPFKPGPMRAPRFTVLELNQREAQEFLRQSHVEGHRAQYSKESEVSTALLIDDAYSRYSSAALRLIQRQHATLSNEFSKWMLQIKGIQVIQERQYIDAVFHKGGRSYLVEFKIAYLANTKRAIREALGQILEYNYYPPRVKQDRWLLVLNKEPGEDDRQFLVLMRKALQLPMFLGWRVGSGFNFYPSINI
jgi:hypothetical protein